MITLDGREVLTVEQAADRANVARKTFTGYVAKGTAPAKDDEIDARTPVWFPATIDEWRPRKGRAKRT